MSETESTPEASVAPTEEASGTEPTASTAVDNLELLVTIFKRGEKSHGIPAKRQWAQFVCDLKRGSKARGKLNLGGWCPAQFAGNHRKLETVNSVHALVLDIDNKVPGEKDTRVPDDEIVTIDAVLAALAEHEVYVYATWNHDPAVNWPRFRAIVPFERSVTGAEYPALWAACRDRLVTHGIAIDEQTKDASRLWFWPAASRPGYETRHQRGRALAVEDVVSTATDEDGAPLDKTQRIRAYLAKCSPAISGSGGHQTAFSVVRCAVRGFDLSENEAFGALKEWNERCDPPWTDGELRHKIQDAREKGTTPALGALLTGRPRGTSTHSRGGAKSKAEYVEKEGKLLYGELQLADFTAKITSEVLRDDGSKCTRWYLLEGTAADGTVLAKAEVPAKDFAKMEWVATEWGARARLAAGRGAWAHAAAAIQALSAPTTNHIYAHTGWKTVNKCAYYLLPGGGICADGLESMECRPPGLERFGPATTPGSSEALPALRHSLAILGVGPQHVTLPALALVYAAPLASLLGGISFVSWMVGHSGGYKSALAALLQSHWGDFDFNSLPETWTSTINYLETQVHRARDVLLTIDNFVPAQTGYDQQASISKAVRLIQNIGDGQDRGRLDSNAEERARRRPMSTVLVTAEILPPDNASTLGRCFVLEVRKGDLNLAKIRTIRQDLPLLRRALGGYVKFIASLDPSSIKETFEAMRADVLDGWRETTDGRHSRLPDMLAYLRTGAYFMLKYGTSLGLENPGLLQAAFDEGFKSAARKQPRPASLTAVDLWLNTLKTLLRTHEVGLQTSPLLDLEPDAAPEGKRSVPLVGWIVGEEVWLDPTASYRAVVRYLGSDWRFSQTELGSQLKTASAEVEGCGALPVLQKHDKDNATTKRTVGGCKIRVLVVDRRVLGAESFAGLRTVATDEVESDGTVGLDF